MNASNARQTDYISWLTMSTMTTARTHGDMRTALECDMARINGQSTTTSSPQLQWLRETRLQIYWLKQHVAMNRHVVAHFLWRREDEFFLLKMKKRNLNRTRVNIIVFEWNGDSHTWTVARQPNNEIVINSFGFMCVAWINKSDTAHHVRDAHVTYVC